MCCIEVYYFPRCSKVQPVHSVWNHVNYMHLTKLQQMGLVESVSVGVVESVSMELV